MAEILIHKQFISLDALDKEGNKLGNIGHSKPETNQEARASCYFWSQICPNIS